MSEYHSHHSEDHDMHSQREEENLHIDTGHHKPSAESVVHANERHWNQQATKYNTEPWQLDMSSQITSFLQTNLEFIGCDWQSNIRLLDYACGTGMVTQALASSVTEAVGVDISSVMIEKYAEFTKSTKNRLGGALSPQTYVGNLLAAVDDEHKQNELDRQLSGFDLVAVGLGFHHFPDHQSAVERLSARLKGGGVLLVIDFTPQNKLVAEGEQGTRGDISASGFASAQMRVLFEAAGLTTFAYREMEQQVELHRSDRVVKKTVFMARGRKP